LDVRKSATRAGLHQFVGRYNSVNLRCGYSQLDIRSPKEIVNNEDDN